MKRSFLLILLLMVSVTLVLAKDFWENPYTEWSQKNVVKMLTNSPWATQTVVTQTWEGRGGTWGTGTAAGEREFFDKYTLRFFSALPIRQAYVRSLQIMNNYDAQDAARKQVLDNQFASLLNMDVSDQVIVLLECETNNPQLKMQIDQALRTTTAEMVKQGAFLITKRSGRIELKEYFPPSPQAPGAKFVFPRLLDGQPVVSPEDKDVRIEMWVPGSGAKLFVVKKIKDMMYQGKLQI